MARYESIIVNSTFKYNDYGATGGGPNGSITNCVFDSNIATAINTTGTHVTSCIIKHNGVGIWSEHGTYTFNDISDNKIGIETYGDKITCNSICSNTQYNIVTENTLNQSASNNYWCLPDSASIQATIYDGHQNLSDGLEFFVPFDTIVCNSIAGIKELPAISNSIRLYPNPSNGLFTIKSSGMSDRSSVEVYNMLGEQVYTAKLDGINTKIDLSNNTSGIYLYRVITETGSLASEGKFVIQK